MNPNTSCLNTPIYPTQRSAGLQTLFRSALVPDALPHFTALTAAQIIALPIPPWRVKRILPQEGLAAIFGPAGSGKSFLALDLAASIARGNDWFGHRVKPGPVIYVALEGEGGFQKRIRAWEQANECNIPDNLQFVINAGFRLNDPASVRGLAQLLKKTPGATVMIDTMNRAAPDADENNSKDMGAILHGCKLLQRLIKGLVILVHHTGKDVTKGLRGHSSLFAAIDAAIEVSRDDADIRSWTVFKSKDDLDGAEFFFRLTIEQLGTDEDGDAVTSCAIEPTTQAAIPRASGLRANEKPVLDAIRGRLEACPLLPWDEAVEAAKDALPNVESRVRAGRARKALAGLLKTGKLSRDPDTNCITLP